MFVPSFLSLRSLVQKFVRDRRTSRRAGRRTARTWALEALEARELLSAQLVITEINPSGSGNGTYATDWFEVTNTGFTDVDITGWKMDDSSNAFASAVELRGLTSIPAGKSVIFLEGNAAGSNDATNLASFSSAWFGTSTPPAGVLIGAYGGSGVGLSTGGDAVNLFNAAGDRVTGVTFGAAPPASPTPVSTFENTAGLGSTTLPLPTVSNLSIAGVKGASVSSNGLETGSPGSSFTGVDLATYVRVGRYDLPEPTRTAHPANNLLAQEVSAVTYNWDTDTLFVVGDGGTSVVQVSKTGELIDSMTLPPGTSPQGTEFYDPEGLTYVGNGQFVMVEERDRQLSLFTYVPGGTLARADAQVVDLGTFAPNIGIEGLSYDPQTGGFIAVKEISPQGIFQTTVDFNAGTASNGSPSTENSIDLFPPALTGLSDFADVFALSNLTPLRGRGQAGNLLILSQEDGRIVNIDRSGNILSALTIVSDAGNPLSVSAQQHEGLTMDGNGFLYVVSENGGGDFDHPQLWVYAPSAAANAAPTALTLTNQVNLVLENSSTVARLKVADVVVTDDGIGTNHLAVAGTDAAFFEVDSTGLYIKAGTTLDYESQSAYSVEVRVDDPNVGSSPDATAAFSLTLTDVENENPNTASLYISEVAPWSSGNSPVNADWFEVTNSGNSPVDITGWKMDDNSNAFASAVALSGVSTIAPGESVIFIETTTPDTTAATFRSLWFGTNVPANLQIGTYSGSGVGLSTGGDAVNLFSGDGLLQAKVTFGASPTGPFRSFNNAARLNQTTISTLSAVGVNGAFVAANDSAEIGSPGTVGRLFVSEVAPWSSGNSPVSADWFEVTNSTAFAIDITGWKMDDNSGSFAAAVALNGITRIAPGESVIFIETSTIDAAKSRFLTNWFGSFAPAGLQVGGYSGSGVGLSTGSDEVNLYNAAGALQARVAFGASPAGPIFSSFDNSTALNNTAIAGLSSIGVHGGFVALGNANEVGSPGTINNRAPTAITDDVTTDEDTAVTFNVLTNDSDPDADLLTVIGTTGVGHGQLNSNGGGSFIYTPHPNYHGPDDFTYTITDGKGSIATGTIRITVTAVNDEPVLTAPSSRITQEDIAVKVTGISVSDVDVAEGTGVVQVVLSVASGTVSVSTDVPGGLTANQLTGNGTGRVVLQGSLSAINATLADGVAYLGNVNFHGDEILSILADDLGNTGAGGAQAALRTVAIKVQSPTEQITLLQSQVTNLYREGKLRRAQANSLQTKLARAQDSVNQGKLKNASSAVNAFQNQLMSFVFAGTLSSADATPLRSDSRRLSLGLRVGGGF